MCIDKATQKRGDYRVTHSHCNTAHMNVNNVPGFAKLRVFAKLGGRVAVEETACGVTLSLMILALLTEIYHSIGLQGERVKH